MAETTDVVVETVETREQFCSESPASDQEPETTRTSNCQARIKSVLLLAGFMCIVSCFVFASLGYIELKSCPASAQDASTKSCNNNSYQFKQAQSYRLAAALLFIVGICIIIVFIWMVKKDNRAPQYVVRTDVVVSDVTEEGLLKTPAPELPHPRSQLHRVVYERISDTTTSQNDLPHYESALKLNKQGDDKTLGVTSLSETINLRGVVMESVSVQVDEDEINPPPSYSQALLQADADAQNIEELDNG
jgi:hypothetical protein